MLYEALTGEQKVDFVLCSIVNFFFFSSRSFFVVAIRQGEAKRTGKAWDKNSLMFYVPRQQNKQTCLGRGYLNPRCQLQLHMVSVKKQRYLHRSFCSLSPLTLNCETPSINSARGEESNNQSRVFYS